MKDVEKLRSLLFKDCEVILETGFTKPLAIVQIDDIPNIVQTATLHRVILRSLAELSQFRDGIQELGVAGALNQYPNLLYDFFVNCKSQEYALTAGIELYLYTYINMYCM